MPPPCLRCESQRVINLETTRKLGTAAGALAGSIKGAYASLYSPRRLPPPTTQFPLSRIAIAVIAGASGGIAGAAAGHQMVQHLFPPGEGIPWLCLGCGHAFRFDGEAWQKHFDLHLDITILAMWGTGPSSIYAVGDEGLILHWDGLGWQRMTSGTKSALYNIWGMDDAHILAVGDFGLILRWNGGRSQVPSATLLKGARTDDRFLKYLGVDFQRSSPIQCLARPCIQ